jgi:hypothetical protein
MSSALQEILEKVPSLSEEERTQLLAALTKPRKADKRKAVDEVYGKYANTLSDVDDFLRRKRLDVARENRKFSKRP